MTYFNAMVSILITHINAGKLDDAAVCADIAAWVATIPFGAPQIGLWSAIGDFVCEYGEDDNSDYMGRDEHGEKQYHTYNPDTNWNTRIRRALDANGYYDRYNEWAKEQAA
jgi:hypothetical protein